MRALLTVPLLAACHGGIHSGGPDGGGSDPVSLVAAWSLHDATSGVPLLCNAGETVTVTVGGASTQSPCAGTNPYDGTLNRTTLADVPIGAQTWNVVLRDAGGTVQAALGEAPIQIAGDEEQLPMIDLHPSGTGTTGGLAIVWDIVSADHTQFCSGALREALEVDAGASTYVIHAGDWKAAFELDVPAIGAPFATVDGGVPTGTTSATVRLVNTQDDSTEASADISPTVVAGRTAIVPQVDFIHCP